MKVLLNKMHLYSYRFETEQAAQALLPVLLSACTKCKIAVEKAGTADCNGFHAFVLTDSELSASMINKIDNIMQKLK